MFSFPKRNSMFFSRYSPYHLSPVLANANLLFVSIDLPIMDISHKWNHKTCGLLWLVSFPKHNVFNASMLPCWRMVSIHSFLLSNNYSFLDIPLFMYLFISWWTFRLFPLFGYCEYCCYENECICICLSICFKLFGVYAYKWIC